MIATTDKSASWAQELDRRQLRALLGVFRKNEWRGGMNPLTQKRGGAISGLLGAIALNLFLSLAIIVFVIKAPDIQSGLTIGGLFISVIVGFQVLMEYGKTIIAPEDYSIIAALPVSSRTFYVAKQLHFLSHVTIVTLSLGLAPFIAVIVVSQSALIALEALVVFWLCGIFAGQLVSIVYTLLLNTKRPERIERILTYAQMALSLSFTMMYFWFSRLAPVLTKLEVDSMPLLKLAPSYWFAAPFRLALEGWRTDLALTALLGAIAFVAFYFLAAKNLSLNYAQSLLQTSLTATTKKSRKKFKLLSQIARRYFTPESRAVLTLMKAQFRGDSKFRIQSVVIVPMLLVFGLAPFFNESGLADPFVSPAVSQAVSEVVSQIGSQIGESSKDSSSIIPPVYLILMILPMQITMTVFHSAAFKAAWVFYASPSSRERLLTGARTIAFAILLVPIFIGLTGLFTYFYGNLLHAILHALFVTSIVRLPVTVSTFINPGIPFSLPMSGGSQFTARGLLNMLMPVIGMVPLVLIESIGYSGYLTYALILGISLTIGWAVTKTTDPYLIRRFKTWEFLS